jgi:hypothetical protein
MLELLLLGAVIPETGNCEHGYEYLRSIKGGEFLDLLSDCQLLKELSVPWSQLLILLVVDL